jgi:hypothetical protein
VTITPFGEDVEPEVYWIRASASSLMGSGCQSPAAELGMVSLSIQREEESSEPAKSGLICARILRVVSAAAGRASATMRRKVSGSRFGRGG